MISNKGVNLLFVSLCTVYCASLFFAPLSFKWLIKISPIICLIAVAVAQFKVRTVKYLIGGLVFSIAGDVFLALPNEAFFVYGLGAFLVAHLFYIASMLPLGLHRENAVSAYALYCLIMMTVLISHLGHLLIPVLLYMFVLLFMGVASVLSKKSNVWLVLGGIGFVVSDSVLGIDKFFTRVPQASLLIMVSYYFAQYCLTRGILIKVNSDVETHTSISK